MKNKPFFRDEQQLIAQLQQGSQDALAYLYKQHLPMIRNMICRNSGSDEDAEEIYQEALVVVYEKLREPNFVLSCSLKTYIYSICRNMWLYQLRKNDQARRNFQDFEQYVQVQSETEHNDMPAYEHILGNIMEFLDPKCRELLRLFYYENLSLDIIAQSLGYNNSNTAKSKKNKCMEKARDKGKELLEQYHKS